jgi:hypothetical protein
MRISGWLLLLVATLVSAGSATVTGQEVIEWSSARRLSKDDFKGRVPISGPAEAVSSINIDASWECEAGELSAGVRATFNPAQSWWRIGRGNIWGAANDRRANASRAQLNARTSMMQRDAQLLEHEQLHFDLAEIAARRIRARFEEFRNGCAEPGRTEPIAQIIAEIDRDLQDEQLRYDRETAYGTNAEAQDRWRRRVLQLLADLPAHSQNSAAARPR